MQDSDLQQLNSSPGIVGSSQVIVANSPSAGHVDFSILPISSFSQATMVDDDDNASLDSCMLSSAPSLFPTQSLGTMRSIPALAGLHQGEHSANDSTGEGSSIPAIFLGSKKARKSWVWDTNNGEEYLEHGKWQWHCVRCESGVSSYLIYLCLLTFQLGVP